MKVAFAITQQQIVRFPSDFNSQKINMMGGHHF